ncbi:MAG: hypothetical protein WBJ68_14270 [Candidatus Dechloromonas phosphoritropha]
MKVFKGEKVVITPRDLGQLRDADLVFMDLLSTLDHHRPQGQKFVAIVVVALGIGQGAPAPALGDLVEGHAVRASARSPMTWTVKPELAGRSTSTSTVCPGIAPRPPSARRDNTSNWWSGGSVA